MPKDAPSKLPNIPTKFNVFHDDEPAEAMLDFASDKDVKSAASWRVPGTLRKTPSMQSRASEARELAMLAAKRWRHYRSTHTTAHSLDELRAMIAAAPKGEFCFHLKVTADWFPASLGGVMVRRTWCHHLMLDFLFVHPSISGRTVNVRGVGLSIFQAVCMIAHTLGCPLMWGEATRDSSTFYQRQLHRISKTASRSKGRNLYVRLQSGRQGTAMSKFTLPPVPQPVIIQP